MKFPNVEAIQSLAVVGATGLVGTEFLEILSESKIKIRNLKLLASEDSSGRTITLGDGTEYEVEPLTATSFNGVEVALFSVPAEVTRKYVPIASKAGTLSIVDSSVFRMDPDVALVVPEVNGDVLRDFQGRVISIPNCTTTPLVQTLKPLLDSFGIKRVVVSTYQSVSGAGKEAYEELSMQTASLLNGRPSEASVFPHRIAFNCLPKIGSVLESGETEEERKLLMESRKILRVADLKVSSTSVRVPTFFGHGLSVNVELKEDFGSVEDVRQLFEKTPGLKVIDKPEQNIYPTNVEATGSNETFVGRVRRDLTLPSALNYWIVSDNLRKGAALNGLQILDTLYRYRRMS